MKRIVKQWKEIRQASRGKTLCFFIALFGIILCTSPAFAADNGDPVAAVSSLEAFVASLISAIGTILLLYSIVQYGIAHKNNDAATKSHAVLGIVGGLIVAGAPWIVVNIL